jgi:hypothetical protein
LEGSQLAQRKRTSAQILEDYVEIEILSHKGKSDGEIAKILSAMRPYKLGRTQIAYDRVKLQEIWKKNSAIDMDTEKGRILSEIRMNKKFLYDLLDRSVRTSTVRTKEANMVAGQVVGQRLIEKTEDELGDMKISAEIRAWTIQEMAILGVEAPKEIKGSGGIFELNVKYSDDKPT